MKKLLLMLCLLGAYVTVSAQNMAFTSGKNFPKVNPKLASKTAKAKKYSYTNNENSINDNLLSTPNPILSSSNKTNSSGSFAETIIGTTYYDLQSNGSVRRQLVLNSGTLSAAFTFSQQSASWTDRGTGYCYNDGSVWSANPTARIESSRTGWGGINITTSGREVVIAHDGSEGLYMSYRDTKGTGTWTETGISTITGTDVLWPRSAVGGADGNTIHLIAITYPVASGGSLFKGSDGALLYYRSQDQGDSWDIQDSILPGLDTAFFIGFGGDQYAIAALGNTVAIAVFGQLENSVLFKSTDNGDTWTKKVIFDFPLDKYTETTYPNGTDTNNDAVADTLYSTDGVGSVTIDKTGKVHVFYGLQRYMDDDVTDDGAYSYFPLIDGLYYWNEDMNTGEAVEIAAAPDLNGDNTIDPSVYGSGIDLSVDGSLALYYASLTSMPNCAVDDSNFLYVTYSTFMESLDQGSQNYRHIYGMMSKDGGSTWMNPVHLTNSDDDQFGECVFGSVAADLDGYLHLVFQRDVEPGLSVRGDQDAAGSNDYIYMKVSVDSLKSSGSVGSGIKEVSSKLSDVSLYPNPASSYTSLSYSLKAKSSLKIEVKNVLGKTIEIIAPEKTVMAGTYCNEINTSKYASGVYFVNVISNNRISTEKLVVR